MTDDLNRVRDRIDAHIEQDRIDHQSLLLRIDSMRDMLDAKSEAINARLDLLFAGIRTEVKDNITSLNTAIVALNQALTENTSKTSELKGEFRAKAGIFGLLGGILPALAYVVWRAF